MPKLNLYPFLRLLIPLLCGMFTADYMTKILPLSGLLNFALIAVSLFFIQHYFWYRKHSLRWLSGALTTLFLVAAGAIMIHLSLPSTITNETQIKAVGVVKNIVYKPSGWNQVTYHPQYAADSTQVSHKTKWLLLVKDSLCSRWQQGDQIMIKGTLHPLPHSGNPHAFDYGQYLMRQGFSAQMFLSDSNMFKVVKQQDGIKISQLPYHLRKLSMSSLQLHHLDTTAMTIVNAFLLGDRSGVDRDITDRFIKSGVIHILAVSGLHVGILSLMIDLALSLILPPKRHLKWILTILLLVGYAFITGFSPSVSRAVFMFSCLQAGKAFRKDINQFQLLSFSAFILLLINPLFIYHAGFWLSHLAVAGIVAFYRPVYNLIIFRFPVWQWSWSLISVSVSAQISTFPLSLYQFGAFPIYFLLANLLVLPLVAPIMILALCTLLLHPIPVLPDITGAALNDLIHYIVMITTWIEQIPHSYLQAIWVSIPLMLFLYLALIAIYHIYCLPSAQNWIRLCLYIIAIGVGLNIQFLYKISHPGIVVYNTRKNTLIELFTHGSSLCLETESLSETTKNYARNGLIKYLLIHPSKHEHLPDSTPSVQQIDILQQRYAIIHGFNHDQYPILPKKHYHGLILGNNNFDLTRLLKSLDCPLVIATSESLPWQSREWKNCCKNLNRRFYHVTTEDALIINLNN
ncbi:ComEC/Rec2 family competence protein [Geofilum sp. OHC36d9]|uniref:ComEC/Rec2 family competence protein n=1 Tax=Geofilum sp. OHC36d9 TaxID=3458413 RepID=UPI0040337CB7